MSQKKASNKEQVKALPDFIAYAVNGKHWNSIGAAWTNADRKGLSIVLHSVPVDGKIVLRQREVSESAA